MGNLKDKNVFYVGMGLVTTVGYILLSFFIQRHESLYLIPVYGILFILYFLYLSGFQERFALKSKLNFALFLRFIMILSLPTLSDDLYRFVWDGTLILEGINPYSIIPSQLIAQQETLPNGISAELYQQLNSPEYFTVYPPLSQAIFALTTFLGGGRVYFISLMTGIFVLLAEAGTIYAIKGLLKRYKKNQNMVLWYAFNPLIIIELSGNLHYEAFMIFFIVLSIALLSSRNFVMAGVMFGLAVSVKLIPLIFLPLFIRRLPWKNLIYFYAAVGITVILLCIPFVSRELITGINDSIGLYFHTFEFNASIYYLLREVGWYEEGFNIIRTAGPRLALLTFGVILLYSRIEKLHPVRIFDAFLWVMVLYFSLATTVHPWYLATLVAMAVFTEYRFPVVWSGLIFLTYVGYTAEFFKENYVVVIIEYSIVLIMLLLEVRKKEKQLQRIP